jgi:serine/threonine protein kinase
MELCYKDLDKFKDKKQRPALPNEAKHAAIKKMFSAITQLHQIKFVHRDLKPVWLCFSHLLLWIPITLVPLFLQSNFMFRRELKQMTAEAIEANDLVLVDFGSAICKDQSPSNKFVGTTRYASINMLESNVRAFHPFAYFWSHMSFPLFRLWIQSMNSRVCSMLRLIFIKSCPGPTSLKTNRNPTDEWVLVLLSEVSSIQHFSLS